jgi:hypothetical protein
LALVCHAGGVTDDAEDEEELEDALVGEEKEEDGSTVPSS